MKAKTIVIILVVAIVAFLLYYIFFMKQTLIKPVEGKITSPFGPRKAPTAGASSFHNGTDIGAPTGTPVKCPLDGEILSIDGINDTSGGLQLLVKHIVDGKQWITGYAHLSGFNNIKVGQKVKQYQVIAFVGNTGVGTGAHLHFTLTNPQGQKVDPELYFNKKLA